MENQITLQELIIEKNISQSEAAGQIGISRSYLNQLLNARLPAGRQVCVKLARWSGGRVDIAPLMVAGLGYLEKQMRDDFDPELSRKIDEARMRLEIKQDA